VKLVLFTRGDTTSPQAGVLTDGGIVPLRGYTSLVPVIDNFAEVGRAVTDAAPVPLAEVQLLAPLPRPGKIICSTCVYGSESDKAPLLLTLKSAESVIGPGQTVQLPMVSGKWTFVPEAELGLVIRGPAKSVKASDWGSAVFGYTCVIDVMAQGDPQFGRDFWLAKSDTLGPLGPCVVTADEVADPQALRVQSFVNGEPAQEYAMAHAQYTIAEHIELATNIMTLRTGDVLACGTSRQGLRSLGDGDEVQVDITSVGRLSVRVAVATGVHA
jgi:2-keto-4-pentenoate hydratase/2-oxohepta-3-ene-1,7-dioic acid hydratase in catechol pathway